MRGCFVRALFIVVIGGGFVLPFFVHAEGRVVFEIEPTNTTTAFWGRASLFGVKKIAIKYKPLFTHSICELGQKIQAYRNPQDDLIISIYRGAEIESADLVEAITIPAAEIVGSTNSYTHFPLDECFIVEPGEEYNFVFSRSKLSDGDGYISAIQYAGNPQLEGAYAETNFYRYFKGGWHEDISKELSLQLMGYREPVVIIPGILGTRINNSDTGEEIWPGGTEAFGGDEELDALILGEDGQTEVVNSAPGRMLDGILIFNAYEELVREFEDYEEDGDLLLFAYDWRKNIKDVATTLSAKIANFAEESVTGEVNIIAHSMGAVLAKEYLRINQKAPINHLLSIGAPQIGSPKGFKALNYGDNLGIAILNEKRIKIISQNMPAVYQLLPSEKYLDINGGYIRDFRNGSTKILDFSETITLMTENENDSRNPDLISQANKFHEDLDNYDIELENWHNIVSCNETKTVGEIYLYDNGKIDVSFTNGDGTVPLVSAIYQSENADSYFVLHDETGTDHRRLVVDEEPLILIKAIIDEDLAEIPEGISQSIADCSAQPKFKVVSTHSPVIPHFYDLDGNHTGPGENGDIEIEIPGSEYFIIGENHFGIIPAGVKFRVEIESTGIGSFDLKIKEVEGTETVSLSTFLSIPIESKEQSAEYTSDGKILYVYEGGDSNIEVQYSANVVLGSEGIGDIEPPTITFDGIEESEYVIGKILSIFTQVTDSGSGVEFHAMNLDGEVMDGHHIETKEIGLGKHILEILAYDFAGNLATKIINFSVVEEIVSKETEEPDGDGTAGAVSSGSSASTGQVLGASTISPNLTIEELEAQLIQLLQQLIALLQERVLALQQSQ